jgi:hypothetical protein
MEGEHAMTQHDARERGFRREECDEQEPKAVWGHSFAAAAVCLGTGATVALVAILG